MQEKSIYESISLNVSFISHFPSPTLNMLLLRNSSKTNLSIGELSVDAHKFKGARDVFDFGGRGKENVDPNLTLPICPAFDLEHEPSEMTTFDFHSIPSTPRNQLRTVGHIIRPASTTYTKSTSAHTQAIRQRPIEDIIRSAPWHIKGAFDF
ncbi:hypothetical protein DL96DRAFT_1626168 [Flagelloscypha sp. PMI_526]|nr:hypothetical protein DL96DRAFT_1626168 [Flagelloscypha sp. PMI_526]